MRSVRLELTASRLKGGCSTTELRALEINFKEQKNIGFKPNTYIITNFLKGVQHFVLAVQKPGGKPEKPNTDIIANFYMFRKSPSYGANVFVK